MRFTYLLVDFFTVIIPVLFSFHPKIKFYKNWRAFIIAALITAALFLTWDSYFVKLGVWGFNSQYVTGTNVANLPVEEILFFICIPYACIFTFHCLNNFTTILVSDSRTNNFTLVLIIVLFAIGIFNFEKLYTAYTFLSLATLLAIAKYVLHITWLPRFYIVYFILLVPFLVVNGILTGTGLENPVVWYNDNEIIGIRILTIPFEDIFYGMELIFLNLLIYQYLLFKMPKKAR